MIVEINDEQIVLLHDISLEYHGGGLPGVKEPGRLSLIAEKPFMVSFGQELYPGLFYKAAVLMYGLIRSHCFFDGNKRTGVLATTTFLKLNGIKMIASNDEMFHIALAVAKNEIDEQQLAIWLEQNSIKA